MGCNAPVVRSAIRPTVAAAAEAPAARCAPLCRIAASGLQPSVRVASSASRPMAAPRCVPAAPAATTKTAAANVVGEAVSIVLRRAPMEAPRQRRSACRTPPSKPVGSPVMCAALTAPLARIATSIRQPPCQPLTARLRAIRSSKTRPAPPPPRALPAHRAARFIAWASPFARPASAAPTVTSRLVLAAAYKCLGPSHACKYPRRPPALATATPCRIDAGQSSASAEYEVTMTRWSAPTSLSPTHLLETA